MSLVEVVPVRNLSLRYRKEVRARLWNAPVKPRWTEVEKRAFESAVIGDDQYTAMLMGWINAPLPFFKKPVAAAPIRRQVTFNHILAAVGRYFLIETPEILSRRRDPATAYARQVAMYLNKKLTIRSVAEIGRRFDRDHTTALYAIRKIAAMLAAGDEELAEQIEAIKLNLGISSVPACAPVEPPRGEGV